MLHNPCSMLMKQINDALEKRANNSLRSQGLTMTQATVLFLLSDLPDKTASLKELEQALSVAQSTTAGIVKRLEQKKLLESFGDSSDKRIKMVRLTPKGEQCCLDSQVHRDATEQDILSGLTREEQVAFRQLLQKVHNNLK